MSTKDGGPAFPVETYGDGRGMQTSPASGWKTGMSLRDYFAAQAITGCCPGSDMDNDEVLQYAEWAYRMADAMLEARKK